MAKMIALLLSLSIAYEPPRETAVPLAQVKEVKRNGLSTRGKTIPIPAIAGDATLLVLCAVPYPIGCL